MYTGVSMAFIKRFSDIRRGEIVFTVTQAAYNPAAGFPLPNLAVNASTVVEFDVVVN